MLPEKTSLGDLLLADAELAGMYLDCRAKHGALLEILK